jgi:plasmid stability protein
MIRADLTDEEMRALRVQAARRDLSVQALVSELLQQAAAKVKA